MSKLDRLVSELADALAPENYRASWSLTEIRNHLADDRERRIRELAREWLGRAFDHSTQGSLETLIANAAHAIDALDAAEVPPKDAGGES